MGGTGKDRLDRSVVVIAHPTVHGAAACMVLDKRTKTDALHPPTDSDVPDDAVITHVYAPDISISP
jgi:hypothetical protein